MNTRIHYQFLVTESMIILSQSTNDAQRSASTLIENNIKNTETMIS